MLKFTVDGQKLELLGDPHVVADSFDFLTGSFKFYSGSDWDLTEKHVFFQLGEAIPYEVILVDDQFIKTDHVNLTTGTWSIYVIGYDIDGATPVEIITTDVIQLNVERSGVSEGDPFPPSIIPKILVTTDQTEEQTFENGVPKLAADRVISDDRHIVDKAYVDGSHPDHNDLNGLQGGAVDEYYHITQEQSVILGNTSGENTGDQSASDFNHGDLTGLQGGSKTERYHMTQAENTALHAHSNKTALDAVAGVNTGDQAASSFNHNDLANKQGGTTNEFYHVTEAEKTVIQNTSGTNTGDQTLPTRDSLGLDTDDTVTFANLSGTNTGDQDVSGAISTHNTDLASHAVIKASYKNDFLYDVGINPWAGAAIAAGSLATAVGDSKHPGVNEYRSHASNANSGYLYKIAVASLILVGGEETTIIFKTATAMTGVTRRMGFLDAADHNAPTDGVYCRIVDGVLTGHCASNTILSTSATSYTLSANTWYRLKTQLNTSATVATFTLFADDSASVLWTDTLNSNIPTGSGRNLGHGDFCTLLSPSGMTTIGYIDYMEFVLPNARRIV